MYLKWDFFLNWTDFSGLPMGKLCPCETYNASAKGGFFCSQRKETKAEWIAGPD